MKNLQVILVIFILFSLSACFSGKEDPLEKERKEFNESIADNTSLNLYRGIKISIRSLALNKELGNLDSLIAEIDKNKSESENIRKYTISLLTKALNVNNTKTEISVTDALEMIKIYGQLKKELKDANEDDYPTILEVLLFINSLQSTTTKDLVNILGWNNSKEHLILATILSAAKPLPESFQLYELSKLNIADLDPTEIKPVAALLKGLMFAKNKWYYLSEESLNQGITSLETEKIIFEYQNYPALFENTKVDSYDAQIAQMHGVSCLFRGFVRTKMDDEDKHNLALEDFEMFLKDAKTIGLDNELVWFAGAYLYISKEEKEKAIPYLEKLAKSQFMTDNERTAIKQIIVYVEDRETDKALNTIYDKLFIGKLVSKYLYNYFIQIDWYKVINQSETGRQFLALPEVIGNEYKSIEKEMDSDNLKEKGKELIDDIF